MTSDDASQMATLLSALTQPDTETIRQAEVALKPLLKDPRCVPALLGVIKNTSNPPAVRHVGAIVLRKRLAGHYSKFSAEEKQQIKSDVLTILSNEQERVVRTGVVGVAAILIKCDDIHNWPELFQFIGAAASDASEDARELSLWLISSMTETIGMHLKPQFQSMATLFHSALNDASPKVRIAAVKALGQLLSYLADEQEIECFTSLIPPLLKIAESCRAAHDEDVVSTVLEVLYDLAYSPSPAVAVHLRDIVVFCLNCVVDQDLEISVRDPAALVIATMAESKPKTFGKDTALLVQVLETLMGLIEHSKESAAGALFESNPAWKDDLDEDDEDDFDSPTETSMAQGTLDMLACEMPKKYIFEPVVSRCIMRMASPNAATRKAGVACLGVVAEGCAEPMREHLHEIIPQVFIAAQDSDPQVRECACFCLGQVSEHCQPEILGYSSQILPIVFGLLDDDNVAVQATSCYVLEMFCERLEPDAVRPLLDPLVRKLASMLEATSKRSVQEMAVAALAATAVAAEEEFAPYVEGVVALMSKLMVLKEENMFSLRGRALECMGHMAIAVGRDTFRPYFVQTMQCALEGLALDSTDLHEFAYAVFANLAKVMEQEFAPALADLVPHLCQVIGQDEGQLEAVQEAEKRELQSLAMLTPQAGEFNALDDSDDEDGDGGNYVLHVRTALLEAKKGAITAIGEMAAHTGSAFCPFLEQTMTVLQKAANNWHPLIKCEVAEALPSMVVPIVAMYHNGEVPWTKGGVAQNTMSEDTNKLVSAVMTELVELQKDDDKATVGKACEGIQSVIELCGPHALIPVAIECLENTHSLLNKTAPCQTADEFYGEVPEEDDDHDSFMTSVCDLVGSFARVMGSHFAQYLPQFLPAICEYAKSSRPISDRSMAMGCLSELAQELEGSISEYWESVFLPAILAGLADSDDNVKRNAAFCAGLCCEHLGDSITAQYPQLLQAISPLFSIDSSSGESAAACVDNAAAAVSRMIMSSPTSVPLSQVLPVLLKQLPLKTDMTENETVYTCLLGLLQLNQPDVLANKEELRRIFTEATSEKSRVDESIQSKLKLALQALN